MIKLLWASTAMFFFAASVMLFAALPIPAEPPTVAVPASWIIWVPVAVAIIGLAQGVSIALIQRNTATTKQAATDSQKGITEAKDAVNTLEKQINSNLAKQIASDVAKAIAEERLRVSETKQAISAGVDKELLRKKGD